jgi:hypothetical protein
VNPLRLVTSLMGFLAAALAVARDDRRLGWVAIGFLGVSLGVRAFQAIQRRMQERRAGPTDLTE